MNLIGRTRRKLIGIPSAETMADRPGFTPAALENFEPVAHALMTGFNNTLEDPRFPAVVERIDAVEPVFRGFAYEGAGMGMAVLDTLSPRRNMMLDFVEGPAKDHRVLIYIGAGLAYARLRRSPEAYLGRLDPVLGWFVADGFGFHEAFFHWRRTVERHHVPARLAAYGRRLFDQGVGRALWFTSGADVGRIARLINAYPAERHADLWTGVGLASAYAGGSESALSEVLETAQPYRHRLARGAAIAAWGREDGGNPAEHTDLACKVYAEQNATELAAVAERAYHSVPPISVAPGHEIWRLRIDHELEEFLQKGKS